MREQWTQRIIQWIEQGRVPESLVRYGIRHLCQRRLQQLETQGCEQSWEAERELYRQSIEGPVALVPEKANEQHYEVPADFYDWVLGPHRKYSSCYWGPGVKTLAEAEKLSLQLTCEHAQIEPGQRILELGCGWGSLTLYLLEQFPDVQVTAVSNSSSQRDFILARARERGIAERLTVITADMNEFDIDDTFDRIVSIEMFEHMRNYRELLRRCASWLRDDGKMLVHVFCHRHFCYPFEEQGAANWMGRYFFSGGLMPSDDWLLRFPEDMSVVDQWRWSGVHYQKTADAWLDNMHRNRQQLLPMLAKIYPGQDPKVWYYRWRMLFLAGSELFGARGGQEWWVSHYLFRPTRALAGPTAARRQADSEISEASSY